MRKRETTAKGRNFGLDLARAAAGVLTLSVHFFLNIGFYNALANDRVMLLSYMVRMICMTCVPLFMVITGYTCLHRRYSKGYWRKLLPILLTYVLAGAATMVYRVLQLGERYTPREVLREFTTYFAVPYAWYIEMYIGLFLLTPFFNAAWHSMDEHEKKVLLFSLTGLTALPTVVNQFEMLLPTWWVDIYPLSYYALGAWLREHPLPLKRWQLLLAWLVLAAAGGAKGYVTAAGGYYGTQMGFMEDEWNSLTLMAQAALLFSFLRGAEEARVPAPVRWCVARLARLALPMYLMSYIVDKSIYPKLEQLEPLVYRRLLWMPAVIPVVVVCSALLAQLVDWAVEALMRLVPDKQRS